MDGTQTPAYDYPALAVIMQPFLRAGRFRWTEACASPATATAIQQAIGTVPGRDRSHQPLCEGRARGGSESTTDKLAKRLASC